MDEKKERKQYVRSVKSKNEIKQEIKRCYENKTITQERREATIAALQWVIGE